MKRVLGAAALAALTWLGAPTARAALVQFEMQGNLFCDAGASVVLCQHDNLVNFNSSTGLSIDPSANRFAPVSVKFSVSTDAVGTYSYFGSGSSRAEYSLANVVVTVGNWSTSKNGLLWLYDTPSWGQQSIDIYLPTPFDSRALSFHLVGGYNDSDPVLLPDLSINALASTSLESFNSWGPADITAWVHSDALPGDGGWAMNGLMDAIHRVPEPSPLMPFAASLLLCLLMLSRERQT